MDSSERTPAEYLRCGGIVVKDGVIDPPGADMMRWAMWTILVQEGRHRLVKTVKVMCESKAMSTVDSKPLWA